MPIQTITFKEGEIGYIPSTARVLMINDPFNLGVIATNPDCINLEVEPLLCYEISFAMTSNAGGETQAWEDSDGTNKLVGIYVNNILNTTDIAISFHEETMDKLIELGGGSIIEIASTNTESISDINIVSYKFRTVASIADKMYFKYFINHSNDADIRIYPKLISCPEVEESEE